MTDPRTRQGLPVFFLLHSSEASEVLTAALDNFAAQVTNSPRHAYWPDAPSRILGDSMGVSEALDIAAAKEQASGEPARVVQRILPSHVVIDVSYSETSAIEACMWGSTGWAGQGLERGHKAKVAYCLWHLTMAWSKNVDIHVKDRLLANEIKAALKALRDIPVRPTLPASSGCGVKPWLVVQGPLSTLPLLPSQARRDNTLLPLCCGRVAWCVFLARKGAAGVVCTA